MRILSLRHSTKASSFLPSFKGAKPYYQAHDRGVKLIGATAHFVTGDLDEGPIIEQDVERVDHAMDPEKLTAIGRDVECVVLARAVNYFVEHRILLNSFWTSGASRSIFSNRTPAWKAKSNMWLSENLEIVFSLPWYCGAYPPPTSECTPGYQISVVLAG